MRLLAQSFTAADGTRLTYLDEGAGPPVLLLHALTANAQVNWVETGVLPALVGAGFRVIAPDARGHGGSAAPAEPDSYHPDVLADDVVALVEQLGLGPVSVVGYSYGSRTAAQLAAEGALPVVSVVLGGIAMGSLAPFEQTPEYDAFTAALGQPDPTSIHDAGIAAMRERMAGWHARPVAVASMYAALPTAPAVDLSAIDVPVLVLRSADEPDDVTPLLRDARMVSLGGDHLTAPNDPGFVPAIVDFLAQTHRPGG